MPICRNRRLVLLSWPCSAWAFLCCFLWSFSDVRSINSGETRWPSHQLGIKAASASCIWQTVSCGFFPRPFLAHPGQEQVTHGTDCKMAFQSDVTTAFIMIEPDLSFLIFKTPLHTPTRKGHQQHRVERRLGWGIADEKLQFVRVQHIPSDNQVQWLARQAILVFRVKQYVLAFPDHWPFSTVLDTPPLPGLIQQPWILEQFIDPSRPLATAGQPRYGPATATPVPVKGARHDPWRFQPAGEVTRHLSHKELLALRQTTQESRFATIALIEREPLELDAVGPRPIIKFQGNLPLRPVGHRLWNTGLTTALGVVGPTFRQIKFAVEQTMEIAAGVAEVNGDGAVLLLADRTAPLPLHSGRLVSFFDEAGFVDDSHRISAGMLASDDLLQPIAHAVVVPPELTQELLERPRGHAGFNRDRLDALVWQVRQLPADVDRQVSPGICSREAIVEPLEKSGKFGTQLTNLVGIHACSS